jgi:tetratricopeptide (TPR) repeat protein
MKRTPTFLILIAVLAALLFQGFQCGSPDFTGAKVYIQQKNFKEAIRLLERETERNPDNAEAWWLLGGLKAEQGDYEKMNIAFDNVNKRSNAHKLEIYAIRMNKWGQHLNLGVDYLNRSSKDSSHYYERSIAEFQKAITIRPDTGLTYRYLGVVYTNKGEYDNAVSAYRIAWEKSRDLEAVKNMANIFLRTKEYDEALKTLRLVYEESKDIEMMKLSGRIRMQRGLEYKQVFDSTNADEFKVVSGMKDLKKGVRKEDIRRYIPGAPDEIVKPQEAKGKKKPAIAKEEWRFKKYNYTLKLEDDRVIEIVAKGYTPSIDSTYHFKAMTEFDAAVEAFSIVKGARPGENETLTLLVQAYVESNRLDEAVSVFKLAVENNPSKINHYIYGVLLMNNGKFDDAIAQYKIVIEMDPTYTDAYYNLGSLYYNWGARLYNTALEKGEDSPEAKEKFNMSLPFLEKVTELRPDDSQIWQTLYRVYVQLGMKEKAEATSKKF